MAQKSEPPTIILILIFFLLAGVGYWYFSQQRGSEQAISGTPGAPPLAPNVPPPPPPPGSTRNRGSAFPPPASVPAGTTVRIKGATSMVTINDNLKRGFIQQFPGINVVISASGSEKGIEALLAGSADIAALSRNLTPQEKSQGLVAVPIATDAIALVVGVNNPFKEGLTRNQVEDIFQGNITDWAKVGGKGQKIRVINRPTKSGTYKAFQELALRGGNFGTTPNITSLEGDATTPLLQELKNDGIGYATYAQVANQKTVRTVPIDNMTPADPNYPYKRTLYYVYKNPVSVGAQAFLSYTMSPEGQQSMFALY